MAQIGARRKPPIAAGTEVAGSGFADRRVPMADATDDDPGHALSAVLDRLEHAAHGETTSLGEIVEGLGRRSFAAVILVPALLAVSPLSGVPGVTVAVGLIVAVTSGQMLLGRTCLWLPERLTRRRVPTARLCRAIGWLRRPLHVVERYLRPRLTVLFHRPLVWIPLTIVFLIGLGMPVLELIPTSGSIAAFAITLYALGLLTRDGGVIVLAFAFTAAAPLLVWRLAS